MPCSSSGGGPLAESGEMRSWGAFQVNQYVRSYDVPRRIVKMISREGEDPTRVLPYIEGWIREIGLWPGDQDMAPVPGAIHLHIEVMVDYWPADQHETEDEIPSRDWVFPMLEYPRYEGSEEMMINPHTLAVEVIE